MQEILLQSTTSLSFSSADIIGRGESQTFEQFWQSTIDWLSNISEEVALRKAFQLVMFIGGIANTYLLIKNLTKQNGIAYPTLSFFALLSCITVFILAELSDKISVEAIVGIFIAAVALNAAIIAPMVFSSPADTERGVDPGRLICPEEELLAAENPFYDQGSEEDDIVLEIPPSFGQVTPDVGTTGSLNSTVSSISLENNKGTFRNTYPEANVRIGSEVSESISVDLDPVDTRGRNAPNQ